MQNESKSTDEATPRSRRDPANEEIERALYIDFEGFQGSSPALVGVLVDGRFHQVVLDPALAAAGESKGLHVENGRDWAEALARRAETEQRRICAYSRRELTACRDDFGVDLAPWYLDGRRVAKRAWNRAGRPRPEDGWSQHFFKTRLGLERPRHLLPGNATARLRSVRSQLERRGRFEALTRTAKGKWTNLLAYNQLDVRHLAGILRAV